MVEAGGQCDPDYPSEKIRENAEYEYDTPMQETWVNGYWEEMVTFTRSMFNAAFKTNPYLERAIMTGITSVSRESIFQI